MTGIIDAHNHLGGPDKGDGMIQANYYPLNVGEIHSILLPEHIKIYGCART